jgi:hypothetical protein
MPETIHPTDAYWDLKGIVTAEYQPTDSGAGVGRCWTSEDYAEMKRLLAKHAAALDGGVAPPATTVTGAPTTIAVHLGSNAQTSHE